ncbi:biotin transporter BioY [bacterium D16-51]|nr:biotin transporter BioY [bacterium D16-59]RKI57739.1 biotin transporter BioY [bacterium D16-51]
MALFTAVLCVSAYISIPLPTGSHITFLNFIVLLIAFLFPLKQSFLIVFTWLLLGAAGVPVFVGANAGISYLIGGWGGYSFGFLAAAVVIPLLRKKEFHRIPYTILSALAALLIDIIGAVWLMAVTGISARQAVIMGILPFLPLDLLKAVIVVQIVPQFRSIVTLLHSK